MKTKKYLHIKLFLEKREQKKKTCTLKHIFVSYPYSGFSGQNLCM